MSGSRLFAVLQKTADMAGAEPMKRAFRSFSTLTDADAVRLAVSAQGILMRSLEHDAALAFRQALQAEGIDAAVVAEHDLPRLPEDRLLHRLELKAGAFTVFDLLGRPTSIHWGDLALIAAGAVGHFEISTTQVERKVLRFNPFSGVSQKTIQETTHKVESDSQVLLEIVLRDGATRFRIDAAQFQFDSVPAPGGLSKNGRFVLLVRRVCSLAPGAVLNRGARAIHSGEDKVPEYPSRQRLADEMIWLLWRSLQATRPDEERNTTIDRFHPF